MENPPDASKDYPGARVELRVLPGFEERDVVLSALRQQLEERVIDFELYQERRAAYLGTFLPDPPDIVA